MLFVVVLQHFLIILSSASEGQEEIKSKPGQDVTLQCHGPKNATVTLFEWSRPELKSDQYVFFYRNSRSYENYQHRYFLGRVELRDKSSVKDGDVSVILKNVSINDTGTYECRIILSSIVSGERSTSELRHRINLKVTASGDTAENTWDGGKEGEGNKDGKEDGRSKNGGNEDKMSLEVIVGISVVAVVLLVVIVLIGVRFYKKHKDLPQKSSYKHPPAKQEGEQPA